MRSASIEKRLKLRNPIYEETTSYGHFGREPKVVTQKIKTQYQVEIINEAKFFT